MIVFFSSSSSSSRVSFAPLSPNLLCQQQCGPLYGMAGHHSFASSSSDVFCCCGSTESGGYYVVDITPERAVCVSYGYTYIHQQRDTHKHIWSRIFFLFFEWQREREEEEEMETTRLRILHVLLRFVHQSDTGLLFLCPDMTCRARPSRPGSPPSHLQSQRLFFFLKKKGKVGKIYHTHITNRPSFCSLHSLTDESFQLQTSLIKGISKSRYSRV